MTSIESLSREFAKLAGICWHQINWRCEGDFYTEAWTCDCGASFEKSSEAALHMADKKIYDFTDAREVIRVMWKRSDWKDFVLWFANRRTPELNVFVVISDMENETGEMLELAVDWMKGREANNADR